MMGNTYSQHQTLAQEEWRLVVTALTREYWDATVLPLPLNLFELLINDCVKACMKHRLEAKKQAQKRRLDAAGGLLATASSASGPELTWGNHYLWPKPSFVAGLREDDLMDHVMATSNRSGGGGSSGSEPAPTGGGSQASASGGGSFEKPEDLKRTAMQMYRGLVEHLEKVERDITSLNISQQQQEQEQEQEQEQHQAAAGSDESDNG
jgi:hypothetical protein